MEVARRDGAGGRVYARALLEVTVRVERFIVYIHVRVGLAEIDFIKWDIQPPQCVQRDSANVC